MDKSRVAIYARVSSQQQVEADTIASQVAALEERVGVDGLELPGEMRFLDEGYSGATLVRPGLERLRDLVAMGGVDILYVHSPDRLARKYAYQVLLIDEFERAGVKVFFLNRELGRTPEDELLLQVQGIMAEYERAKILERSRRGKRHAAHRGAVSVLSNAPYGYRYVRKQDGGGEARYEIALEEARVVRQVFEWVGIERVSIGEVCWRLGQSGVETRTGKGVWDRSTLSGMLRNPAYKGTAAFGKTRVSAMVPRLRAYRGRSLQPRRPYTTTQVPDEEWISIAVPPIVSAEVFVAVQEQLQENKRRARQRKRGARYLLQGLVTCARCGYAYYGKAISTRAAKGRRRHYAYYRCIGTDAYRFGGERVCANKQVRTDLLDEAVWGEARSLLEDRERIRREYERRLRPVKGNDLSGVDGQLGKLKRGLTRLIDSYAEGLIEKEEFEPRTVRLRKRIAVLEEQAKQLMDAKGLQAELRLVIGRLDDFAAQVGEGLDDADWTTRREIIRALVKRVEVDEERVNVVFRVNPDPVAGSPSPGILPHCRGRAIATVVEHLFRRAGQGAREARAQILPIRGRLQHLCGESACGRASDGECEAVSDGQAKAKGE